MHSFKFMAVCLQDFGARRSHFDLKAFMPERVGQEIQKRYEIAKEIGAGGYGKAP